MTIPAQVVDRMLNRRGALAGLAGILAGGMAPAAIGSGVLMPVKPQRYVTTVITVTCSPPEWVFEYCGRVLVARTPRLVVARQARDGSFDGVWLEGVPR